MIRPLKAFVVIVAGIVILYLAFVNTLSYHDARTRQRLLQTVSRELPVGASKEDMTEFLRRHTSRFALDEEYKQEYGGFIPQTKWDRFLFDRQVLILFKLSLAGTLQNAEVHVYYTAL